MSTPNRAAILTKIHKLLKKQYKLPELRQETNLLEAALFACCLENARYDVARRALETLRASFFDWNEIRVSTVKELAEVLSPLPEPGLAAAHLKGVLQSVFETDYSFDLEALRKQNLGQAIKRLQKLEGATPFVTSYVTQTVLGGHSIPIDRGALGVLYVVGAISQAEHDASQTPGLERAITKSKGTEFGLLLHELGADFVANPFSTALREYLLSIAPDAKERFPKRKKPAAPEPAAPPAPAPAAAGKPGKKGAAPAKAAPVKPEPAGKKKPPAGSKAKTEAKAEPKAPPAKAPAPAAKKPPAATKKKAPARQLARRKPR